MSVIALAIGEPNGIGPEIAIKAALRFAQERGHRGSFCSGTSRFYVFMPICAAPAID